jgi:hypothetical protein
MIELCVRDHFKYSTYSFNFCINFVIIVIIYTLQIRKINIQQLANFPRLYY